MLFENSRFMITFSFIFGSVLIVLVSWLFGVFSVEDFNSLHQEGKNLYIVFCTASTFFFFAELWFAFRRWLDEKLW